MSEINEQVAEILHDLKLERSFSVQQMRFAEEALYSSMLGCVDWSDRPILVAMLRGYYLLCGMDHAGASTWFKRASKMAERRSR